MATQLDRKQEVICNTILIVTLSHKLCIQFLHTFKAELTAKDDIIARKSRELEDKDRLLSQQANQLIQKDCLIADKDITIVDKDIAIADKDATIADKEATIAEREHTIITERERALAEREALIQVARPAVTLCPTLVHLLCWLRCSLTCTGTQGTDRAQRC